MLIWMRRIDAVIFGLIDKLIILLVGVITVAVIATVFARFVLNNSFSWGEELPGLLLVSLTFLGSAWLARYNQHLAFDGLLVMMPPRLRLGIQVFNLLLVELFLACLTYFGWVVVQATGSTSLVTLDFPLVVFRAMVPIGGVLMMLGYGMQLAELCFPSFQMTAGKIVDGSVESVVPVDEAERILAGISAARTESVTSTLSVPEGSLSNEEES